MDAGYNISRPVNSGVRCFPLSKVMKIEINNSLYEQYRQLIKESRFSEDVAKFVEELIKLELRKYCVPGNETDELTGSKSRFCLERNLSKALFGDGWDDSSIYRNRFLCFDLDKFKIYHEAHGIAAGDQVLKDTAKQLSQAYPNTNLYRIGGDEFVVEMGNLPFVHIQLVAGVYPSYSIVDVAVQRNVHNHFVNRAIMFHLDKAIIEASEQVTKIEYRFPDNI